MSGAVKPEVEQLTHYDLTSEGLGETDPGFDSNEYDEGDFLLVRRGVVIAVSGNSEFSAPVIRILDRIIEIVGYDPGLLMGDIPAHMIGTPAHDEALRQVEDGYDVWWSSGEVSGPHSSMALYSLWDHYDEDGQPIDGRTSSRAARSAAVRWRPRPRRLGMKATLMPPYYRKAGAARSAARRRGPGRTRQFNGQEYEIVRHPVDRKWPLRLPLAKGVALEFRQQGYNARVVPVKGGHAVYIRLNRRVRASHARRRGAFDLPPSPWMVE